MENTPPPTGHLGKPWSALDLTWDSAALDERMHRIEALGGNKIRHPGRSDLPRLAHHSLPRERDGAVYPAPGTPRRRPVDVLR